jgi:hypothetical protein
MNSIEEKKKQLMILWAGEICLCIKNEKQIKLALDWAERKTKHLYYLLND